MEVLRGQRDQLAARCYGLDGEVAFFPVPCGEDGHLFVRPGPAGLPSRYYEDVTGAQTLHGGNDVARPGPFGRLGMARAADEALVLEDIAEVAPRSGQRSGQLVAGAFEVALQAHYVGVSCVLREREVEQVVGLARRGPADEVRRHVVGRPEARRERVAAGAGERSDLVEGGPRRPHH